MTTDNLSSIPVQPSQYNSMQNAQPLCGLDHPPVIDPTGPYPTMNYDHVNALPPTRYTGSMGYDYPTLTPPHRVTGSERGNQSQPQLDGHHTPWIAQGLAQGIPIVPGPPHLEQSAYAIPDAPNDCRAGHVPLPYNIAGPVRGNTGAVHSGMSVGENLKNVASHYLHNPGSRVDKLRMMRSRSGAVKVLIVLEIDDTTM